MIYSQIYLQKKTSKLLIAVAVFVALTSSFLIFSMKRPTTVKLLSPNRLIRQDTVNVTSSQIAVFWQSDNKEPGWIEYGESKDVLPVKAFDDRDLITDPKPYSYHLVTLRDLKADTDYYYRVVTEGGIYQSGGTGTFHFKTPKQNLQITNAKPAYGKVLLPNGKPGENIFVFLQIGNNYPQIALSKQTGEWLIPLNTLVNRMGDKNVAGNTDGTKVQLDFYDEGGKMSRINTILANVTPLSQTVVLGQNYSLLAQGTVLAASTGTTDQKATFSVVYPRENALIPAGKPLIKGTGVPGVDVFVFINSKPQFAYRATVDAKGEWRVLPTQNIGAGSYVAAITSKDEKGAKVTINRNFIIAKNGEQVLGVATAEPTLIPSPTTAVPTPTGSTVTPTTGPTPTVIAYISPTIMPTVYITPTIAPLNPTATPQIPRLGADFGLMMVIGIAFLITGGGLMLVF